MESKGDEADVTDRGQIMKGYLYYIKILNITTKLEEDMEGFSQGHDLILILFCNLES